jgi:hypothetical protein
MEDTMTIIEKIENEVGHVVAYDGRLVFWTLGTSGYDSFDIRDVLLKLKGVSLSLAQDALEEQDAEASKARKKAIREAKESAE